MSAFLRLFGLRALRYSSIMTSNASSDGRPSLPVRVGTKAALVLSGGMAGRNRRRRDQSDKEREGVALARNVCR
jgi:hypothetical protein